MKELVRISNLTSHADILKIRSIVSDYEGVLACEINLNKKETLLSFFWWLTGESNPGHLD